MRRNRILRRISVEDEQKGGSVDEVGPKSYESAKAQSQRFIQLYIPMQPRLYGYIISLIPNWSDVDDLVQDTVTVMLSKFDEYKPGTDFCAWALRIAHYKVMNYRRRKKTERKLFCGKTMEAIHDIVVTDEARDDRRRRALRHCLTKLKDNDRKVLQLRYEAGATIRKVSKQLNMSIHTLYKMLSRIHTRLFHCIRRTIAQEEFG